MVGDGRLELSGRDNAAGSKELVNTAAGSGLDAMGDIGFFFSLM
jgi:hypothetical protein